LPIRGAGRAGRPRPRRRRLREFQHDALFADGGLFIDLDDDGRLDRSVEPFLDGERVRASGESWTLSLDYP